MGDLSNFNNMYANLAESTYNNRPNIFPYEGLKNGQRKLLDSGESIQIDYSKKFNNPNTGLIETRGGTNLPNDGIVYLQPDKTLVTDTNFGFTNYDE